MNFILSYKGCPHANDFVSPCYGPPAQWYFLGIPAPYYKDFGPALLIFLFGFSLLITFFHKKKYLAKNKKRLVKKLLLFNILAFTLLIGIANIITSVAY
jgi:hypothetical protein